MTDAFTAADHHYRRAQRVAAKPLPLAAGEVAEYRRRRAFPIVTIIQLITCAVPVICLWALLG